MSNRENFQVAKFEFSRHQSDAKSLKVKMGRSLIPVSSPIKRSKSFDDVNQTSEVKDSDSKQVRIFSYFDMFQSPI